MASQGTRASHRGEKSLFTPLAGAGRMVCDTPNTLGQAPSMATATGTHDAPPVLGRPHGPTASGWVGLQHGGQTDLMFRPPHVCTHPASPKYKLGHTIQLSQAAHPLLPRSVLAANTKDARATASTQPLAFTLDDHQPAFKFARELGG